MKRFLKSIFAGAAALVFFYSCSGDKTREDQAASIIAKMDSPFVVVNMVPQNLMDKSDIFGGAIPETYALIIGFFIDEKVTGIDYSVKSQLVVTKGSGFTPNFYAIFRIKDQTLFKDLMDKEANAELGEKDGFNYAIKESEMYCVTWNEEFAIMSNIPIDFAAMLSGGGGDQGMSMVNKNIDLIKAADVGEPDATYAEFLKKENDVSVYYDGKGLYGYLEGLEAMAENEDFKKMKETYEGMSVEMYMDFKPGSMDFEWVTRLEDKVKKEMDFIADGGINAKLLAQGNSADPIAFGGYNLDFTAFFDYMKKNAGEEGIADMEEGLAEIGLSMDEATGALTGEALWIFDNVRTEMKTFDYGYGDGPVSIETTEPIFGLALGVKDKNVIDKAINSVMEEMLASNEMDKDMAESDMSEEEMAMMAAMNELAPKIIKLGEGIYQFDEGYVYLSNEMLFVSNDSAWTMNVSAGKAVKIKDPKGDIGKYPFAFYMNFASLAKVNSLKEGMDIINAFAEFHGGGNIDGGNFHLIMMDKKKNALAVLTELVFDQLNKLEQLGNEELYEELEGQAEECEGGACEEGGCEDGACEGGDEKSEESTY